MSPDAWQNLARSTPILAIVSALSGFLMGLVVARVIARKEIDALKARERNLEQELATQKAVAPSAQVPAVRKARLTVGDAAVFIGAVAGFVAAAGKVYTESQTPKISDLTQQTAKLQAELKVFSDLGDFHTTELRALYERGPQGFSAAADRTLDGSFGSGSCDFRKVTWVYKGLDPVILKCGKGPLTLAGTLREPAVILLARGR